MRIQGRSPLKKTDSVEDLERKESEDWKRKGVDRLVPGFNKRKEALVAFSVFLIYSCSYNYR